MTGHWFMNVADTAKKDGGLVPLGSLLRICLSGRYRNDSGQRPPAAIENEVPAEEMK